MHLVISKLIVTLRRLWWVPFILLLVPLAYVLLGRSSGSGLIKAIQKTSDARKQEIEALDRIAAAERAAAAKAQAEHAAAVKKEADDHAARVAALAAAKEKREAELAAKSPGELTDGLAKLIGADNLDRDAR